MKLILTLTLVAALAFAGCAGPTTTPTPTGNTSATPTATPTTPVAQPQTYHQVAFVAKESHDGSELNYSFEGPNSTMAGWNNVSLKNEGMEPHQAAFFKLHAGVTYEDVMEMMASQDENSTEEPPLDAYGGVGVASPGQTVTVTMELVEGSYILACFIPGMDGQPHAFHGMTMAFNVTRGTGASSIAPEADVTITAKDFTFELSENLTAGTQVIEMVNAGPHLHEILLVKMQGNGTSADFGAWAGSGFQGPPPGEFVTGMAPHQKNKSVYATVDLTAGNWVLVCFESDGAQGPHAVVAGMVLDVKVQ